MVQLIRWMRNKRAAGLRLERISNRRRVKHFSLFLERLEDRRVCAVSILNNGGNGFSGLSFNQSGGYVPPDTTGAAGPSAYVETVNQALAIYTPKATGASAITDSLSHFFFTTGGLSRADSGSGLSDPIVTYDEKIGRFIVGDQDVNFSTHVSTFDIAVSKSNNPTSLSAVDWKFYKITTTETGFDADYPGNFGYNADALVFTLNMFGVAGGGHVQIVSVNSTDLVNTVASPMVVRNDFNNFSIRPTTMHDAMTNDPMWFVTEHGNNLSIDVIKMTGVLTTTPSFTNTNLAVAAYSSPVSPLNPNGTQITNNIDSRIMKSAEANKTIVATHTVAKSSTQDVAQWYAIDVSGAVPTLSQQGRIDSGNKSYVIYPGIDINAAGEIGMSYMKVGNDTTNDFLSMWVTGRLLTDASGTMETPVIVPSATGLKTYTDFASGHRAGDLSGINIDPVDGSFWAANEFANAQSTANWGTGIANFRPSLPANSADLAITTTGPTSVTAGSNATYTITLTNNGPNTAQAVVLTDLFPAGSTFVSMNKTFGTDVFGINQSSSQIIATANTSIASGSSDTFSLVVFAPSTLNAGSNFSNQASVTSSTIDSNTSNNSSTAAGSIVGPATDLAVANSGPLTSKEGDIFDYSVTVTNIGPNVATGVVLTDTLGAVLRYVPTVLPTGVTISQSGNVLTFNFASPITVGGPANLTIRVQAIEDGDTTSTISVTTTASDSNLNNNNAVANTLITEDLPVVSAPITSTTKRLSNVAVATFTHANGIEPTSAFVATIDWGDRTTSTGTIVLSGTIYTVTGSHRFSNSTPHTITTTVVEIGAAAELLLLKVGDEVPDLPARISNEHDHDCPSLNRQTNDFAKNVDSYLGKCINGSSGTGNNAGSKPKLSDLADSVSQLLKRGKSEGRPVQLGALLASLHGRDSAKSSLNEVLSMIDDIFADFGS